MILVDTSIWIEHFRIGVAGLSKALEHADVCLHPFVLGELACGHLKNRNQILRLLTELPAVQIIPDAEVVAYIESCSLYGRGIGYVDAHLLAAADRAAIGIWTRDKRLAGVAAEHGLDFASND